MNISYLKNKNIHIVECKDWHDVYGYEKSEMKEDIINDIEQLQQENQKYKEVIDKVSSQIKLYGKYNGEKCTRGFSMMSADFNKLLEILKEVE